MRVAWYVARLRRMGAGEIAWRVRGAGIQLAWRLRRGENWPAPEATPCWAGGRVPTPRAEPGKIAALVTAAEAVLAGRWSVFGTPAPLPGEDPDWFLDPATGRRAPAAAYSFTVPYRDEDRVGNVKHLWEISRLHHVTLLAAAYRCTGRAAFAERAIMHLRSWWRANPPLCGIHWTSGIELGLRLIAWVWTRRLLDGYSGVDAEFERNPLFQRQLHAHQSWIARFHSRGSSANNHLIAEMAGLLAAARAFPLFAASPAWADIAACSLERESAGQVFPDGQSRELASAYHVFVLELLLVAGAEADAAGVPLSATYWSRLRAMADALAAGIDARLQIARQGDGDDGRALLLGPPSDPVTETLLAICARLFGPAEWWPAVPEGGVAAALLASLAHPRIDLASGKRPPARPVRFPDAGVAILRDLQPGPEEIWCHVDAGPHGFLATAAHAHADALSFELRLSGQPVLVDPGTYCYHGEQVWRDYFRSTVAHNTLELNRCDQAVHAGPFLWLTSPTASVHATAGLDGGDVASLHACHDGYSRTGRKVTHHRRLSLDRRARTLDVQDWIECDLPPENGSLPARLAFALHPDIASELTGCTAQLTWKGGPAGRSATLTLPSGLCWTAHRGETNPILGWYSPGFGRKQPATLLLGSGRLSPGSILCTRVAFGAAALAQQAA
jgi:uncharacterized heparinase superfamily protein